VEIIAHRGASHDAPENTLSAIRLGWEQGADAVEIDVHCSRDGKVVAIHDPGLRKLARCAGKVRDKTLAELRLLDVGLWKSSQWRNERIPKLEEVLETIPAGKRLFIEIKCGAESIPGIRAAMERVGAPAKAIVIIGFSLNTVTEAKRELPEVEVCWIIERKRNWRNGRWTPISDFAIQRVREAGLDGVDMGVRGLHTDFVEEIKDAKLKCYVWTVDSPFVAARLIKAGIDGITTNRPGWLRQQLSGSRWHF
jgi:glycerophosphoryl diester phosphodiesterase